MKACEIARYCDNLPPSRKNFKERKAAEEQHIKEMEDRMLWYESELNLNPFSWGKKKK